MPRRLLLAAAPLALALLPTTARATCIQMTVCRPVLPDCNVFVKQESAQPPVEVEVWPANKPLSFVMESTTCCHAPGGIGGCSSKITADLPPPEPHRSALERWNEQKQEVEPIEARYTVGRLACLDVPLYTFDAKLSPGTYRLGCGAGVKVVAKAELKQATAKKFEPTPPVRHGEPPGPPDPPADPPPVKSTDESQSSQSTPQPTPTPVPPAEQPPPLANKSGCRQTDTPAPLALLALAALAARRRARKTMP